MLYVGLFAGHAFHGPKAWDVKLPSNIRGLLGSCLVIPCHFDYHEYPPNDPNRVVWYQYVSRGYPLVYDNLAPYSVIDMFKRRTSRVSTRAYGKECSLKIYPVERSHHRQKIYPWVDPDYVGRSTYRFFDKTVTIDVTGTLSLFYFYYFLLIY